RGGEISFQVVADIDAGVNELVLGISRQDDLNVEIGKFAQKFIFRTVEAGTDGSDEISQIVFNAAAGGGHMGGTDEIFTAQSDEVVLVVIGEAKNLVRNDVADVDDPIPRFGHEHAIEPDGERPIGGALGGFVDKASGE